jgi:hypothetical protein
MGQPGCDQDENAHYQCDREEWPDQPLFGPRPAITTS